MGDEVRHVQEVARRIAGPAGMEVVLVELAREQTGRVLRVLIDKPGGVTVDDCALVADPLSRILNDDPPVKGEYSLEVSSPGIERPLVRRADYERFAGSQVAVKLREAKDGRKTFRGTLDGVQGEDVLVTTEDGTRHALPLADVARAHLVVEF
jgi:ribosome maturation factor RimP